MGWGAYIWNGVNISNLMGLYIGGSLYSAVYGIVSPEPSVTMPNNIVDYTLNNVCCKILLNRVFINISTSCSVSRVG